MNHSEESVHEKEKDCGIISIRLGQVYVKSNLASDPESSEGSLGSSLAHGQPLWATIEIKQSGTSSNNAAFWFTKEDENVYTKIMKALSPLGAQKEDIGMYMFDFEYDQLSKKIPINWPGMDHLFGTELVVSMYSGDQRSEDVDQFIGTSSLGLQELVLLQSAPKCADRNHTERRLHFSTQNSLITVMAIIHFSTNVLDYIMGLCILRFHSITVENLPPEFLTTATEAIDTTRSIPEESEMDTSVFTLEINLPYLCDQQEHDPQNSDTICKRLDGGRICYGSKVIEEHTIKDDAMVDVNSSSERRVIVAFDNALTFQIQPREVASFIEYIRISKYAPARLLRRTLEKTNPLLECNNWSLSLNLTELLVPGCKKFTSSTQFRSSHMESKAFFEKRLAAASSQDERKQWQAAVNDYEQMTITAQNIFASMQKMNSSLLVSVEISPSSLVDEAIQVETPAIDLHELLPAKDQYPSIQGQESNAFRQLHAEIRQILLLLMQKYCDFMQNEESDPIPFKKLTRLEKRQSLIYELNTEGIYHAFKEGLKTRILPIIQERLDSISFPESASNTIDHKLQIHGQVFILCMECMNTIMKEVFQKSGQLSVTNISGATVLSIHEIELKVLELELRGDTLACEGVYLDHIHKLESLIDEVDGPNDSDSYSTYLAEAWNAYGCFCLRHDEFSKAVANFEQSLQLNSESPNTLLTYASLLIELQEASRAEKVLRLAIQTCGNERYTMVVIAHALRAYCYRLLRQSNDHSSSHLEMLYAQNLKKKHENNQSVCAASIWLQLAKFLRDLHLSQLSDAVLALMKKSQQNRDILSSEERILYRLLESDVRITNGDLKTGELLLQEALDIDQAYPKTWVYCGRLHMQSNNIERAIESFKSVLPFIKHLDVRDRLTVYLNLGNLLLQCSRMEEAKCVFLMCCSEFSIASCWLGVGIAYYRLEIFQEAKLALAEANRLDSRNPEVWGYLALLYYSNYSKGQRTEEKLQADTNARRCLHQAIRYNLSNALLLRELSSACVATDHLQDAERLLRRSLIFQDSYLTRNILADVLLAQNFAEGALEQYKESLTNDVNSHEREQLLNKCADMLKALGRPDEAEAYMHMHDEIRATEKPAELFSYSSIAENQGEVSNQS